MDGGGGGVSCRMSGLPGAAGSTVVHVLRRDVRKVG